MTSQTCLIVGAGFSGAVLARELATDPGWEVHVIDERPHLAGNCHTERDAATGVMLHRYGPHTFHTQREEVWAYIQRFGRMMPFINRIKASTARGMFGLPINLHTINQFFGKRFNPAEARAFLATLGDTRIGTPRNFEEQALKFLGADLYEAFFRGYTIKQWGVDPTELPASILQRLPVRFNYDDNYYHCRYQGIPEHGYTDVVERLLDHPRIRVQTATRYEPGAGRGFAHLFYTGPLDGYFGHCFGRLGYRTVSFERIDTAEPDFQGNAIINYPELDVPYTRIHEHKHFTPWETHERTVAFREFSTETEPHLQPYYPKRLAADKTLLHQYRALAEKERGVSFLGRLGTYRYLDMDKVIGEALDFAQTIRRCLHDGTPLPVFPNTEG